MRQNDFHNDQAKIVNIVKTCKFCAKNSVKIRANVGQATKYRNHGGPKRCFHAVFQPIWQLSNFVQKNRG